MRCGRVAVLVSNELSNVVTSFIAIYTPDPKPKPP